MTTNQKKNNAKTNFPRRNRFFIFQSIILLLSLVFCMISCETEGPQNAAPVFSEEEEYEEEIQEEADYSRYFRDIMEKAPELKSMPISALCMLGSHDTFTDKINVASAIDTANKSFLTENEDLLSFFKDAYINFAKAQADDAYWQLVYGVRYIDMRVSCIEGEFYNCHTLISDTLENSLKLLLRFLEENPGEFIIVNVHKYYADDRDMTQLETYMKTVMYNGKNIFDYVRYDQGKHDFSELTYNDVTNKGTQSGVVLFSNSDVSSQANHPVFSQFSSYTYMPGPVSVESEKVVDAAVNNIPFAIAKGVKYLRVCQAQTQPKINEIMSTILSVSLLEKAKEHNDYFLKSEKFDAILDAFPIIEFDYATYNETGFVDGILQKMTDKNLSLVA